MVVFGGRIEKKKKKEVKLLKKKLKEIATNEVIVCIRSVSNGLFFKKKNGKKGGKKRENGKISGKTVFREEMKMKRGTAVRKSKTKPRKIK